MSVTGLQGSYLSSRCECHQASGQAFPATLLPSQTGAKHEELYSSASCCPDDGAHGTFIKAPLSFSDNILNPFQHPIDLRTLITDGYANANAIRTFCLSNAQ
jgi:hypothetical protein